MSTDPPARTATRPRQPEAGRLRPIPFTSDPRAFLDALEDEDAARLRELGSVRRYPAGTVLYFERDAAHSVFVLLSGRVKLRAAGGGREVVLDICGPGELLGELPPGAGDRHSSSAVALEPVEALAVPSAAFASLADGSGHLTQLVIHTLSGRLRESERRRLQLATLDTLGRVAALLIELFERFPRGEQAGARIDLPLSQEELASAVGASHKAVTTALRALRELGWIETSRRSIRLRDVDALRRRAL